MPVFVRSFSLGGREGKVEDKTRETAEERGKRELERSGRRTERGT